MNDDAPLYKSDLVTIREGRASDVPFIMSSWLKGLRWGNDWYAAIDQTTYFKVYHALLEALLAKPGVKVKVACLKDEPDAIVGYSVYENNRLHWVQVKEAWRKIGIAKDLVPKEINSVSHLTKVGKSIFMKKNWLFNPFMLV